MADVAAFFIDDLGFAADIASVNDFGVLPTDSLTFLTIGELFKKHDWVILGSRVKRLIGRFY